MKIPAGVCGAPAVPDDNLLLNQAHLMTFSPTARPLALSRSLTPMLPLCVGGEAGSLGLLMKTGIYTTTTNLSCQRLSVPGV